MLNEVKHCQIKQVSAFFSLSPRARDINALAEGRYSNNAFSSGLLNWAICLPSRGLKNAQPSQDFNRARRGYCCRLLCKNADSGCLIWAQLSSQLVIPAHGSWHHEGANCSGDTMQTWSHSSPPLTTFHCTNVALRIRGTIKHEEQEDYNKLNPGEHPQTVFFLPHSSRSIHK